MIKNLFGNGELHLVNTQKQEGVNDCGVFAIAVATGLLFGEDPSNLHFDQSSMRSHLLQLVISTLKNFV